MNKYILSVNVILFFWSNITTAHQLTIVNNIEDSNISMLCDDKKEDLQAQQSKECENFQLIYQQSDGSEGKWLFKPFAELNCESTFKIEVSDSSTSPEIAVSCADD